MTNGKQWYDKLDFPVTALAYYLQIYSLMQTDMVWARNNQTSLRGKLSDYFWPFFQAQLAF
jgi:hypothetical protein